MPLTDALARTLGMHLSILTGKMTKAERALLATWWPEAPWMSVPDVVDWYRQEILPRGGDHELQFAIGPGPHSVGHLAAAVQGQAEPRSLPPPAPPQLVF